MTRSTGAGRGSRPLLERCRRGHQEYQEYRGRDGVVVRQCAVCAANKARERYEVIREAAWSLGLTVPAYRQAYGQRVAVAVAVLEGKDPLVLAAAGRDQSSSPVVDQLISPSSST